ncbi:MAG: hypothetical protein HY904_01350 [Deltaproteobacteria bacterium]|nr:hypothetical protein [Deltaproteobacteria bacterium]
MTHNLCLSRPAAALVALLLAVPHAHADTARPWKKAAVQVPTEDGGTRRETRVLRADGTEVTVGDGLRDVGLQARLPALARPPAQPLTILRDNVGRVGVLVVAGGMLLGGGVAAVLGGALWGLSLARVVPAQQPVLGRVFAEALFILFGGVAGMVVGTFTLLVAAVPWAWQVFRPDAVDPETLRAAAASRAWDDAVAADVVARHNAAVKQPPAPRSRKAAARAPEPREFDEDDVVGNEPEEAPPPARKPARPRGR